MKKLGKWIEKRAARAVGEAVGYVQTELLPAIIEQMVAAEIARQLGKTATPVKDEDVQEQDDVVCALPVREEEEPEAKPFHKRHRPKDSGKMHRLVYDMVAAGVHVDDVAEVSGYAVPTIRMIANGNGLIEEEGMCIRNGRWEDAPARGTTKRKNAAVRVAIQMRDLGFKDAAIGRALGVSESSVYHWLGSRNKANPMRKRDAEIREMHDAGIAKAEIAEYFGISETYVGICLKRQW